MGQQEDGGGNYLPFLSNLPGPPGPFQTWLVLLSTSGRMRSATVVLILCVIAKSSQMIEIELSVMVCNQHMTLQTMK